MFCICSFIYKIKYKVFITLVSHDIIYIYIYSFETGTSFIHTCRIDLSRQMKLVRIYVVVRLQLRFELDMNIFYTFRLLIQAIKNRVVGGEDLLRSVAFGEYQYECKGDQNWVENAILKWGIINNLCNFGYIDWKRYRWCYWNG